MTNVCPKCGSTDSIPNACVIDRTDMGCTLLSASVNANPGAWVMKEPVTSPLRAQICGGCGFTEFYVKEPQLLLQAAKEAAARKR